MGVLKELKQQAQSILHQEDAHSDSNKSLNELYRSNVIDSLRKVYDYMHELLDQLHLVKPVISVDFQLGEQLLKGFEQKNYEIHVRSSYDDDVVGFILKLERKANIDISLDSTEQPQDIIRKVKNAGCLIAQQSTYNLELQGMIPVRIYFKSNFDENRIYVIIDNYDKLGSKQYSLKAESINGELLDEFGSLILRRKSRFIEMLEDNRSDNVSQVTKLNDTKDDTEQTTLTQNMNESRIRSLFTRGQHIYLTYHERITEVSSKSNDIMIGRSKSSNIIVDTDCVSRYHAKLVYRKGKFVVIDQSTNGTFIKTQGGQEVFIQNEEYPLSGSGFISLGKTVSVDNEHLIYFSCQ